MPTVDWRKLRDEHQRHVPACYSPHSPLADLCAWCRAVRSTAPVPASSLPYYTNCNPRCDQCGNRQFICVHYDRECHEVTGQHFHRICPCGNEWVEQASEAPRVSA